MKYRENSFLWLFENNNQQKQYRIDSVVIDRNDIDQILIIITSISEYINRLFILILTELFQFGTKYIPNQNGIF